MYLYQKIDDESILLDSECKRLLKRTSRKLLIDEVMQKINENENENEKKIYNKDYDDDTDVSIESTNSDKSITDYYNSEKSNKTFYEMILTICGCNK